MQISHLHNTFAVPGWHGYFLLGSVLNATDIDWHVAKTSLLYVPANAFFACMISRLFESLSINLYIVSLERERERERERFTRFAARWRARQIRA